MPTRRHSDEGETLLELLLAIAIMGIAMVAILGTMQASVVGSSVHHKQSTAGGILTNFAEYMKNDATAPFVDCPGAVSSYATYRTAFQALLAQSSSKVYEPTHDRYTLSLAVVPGAFQPIPAPPAQPPDPSVVFPDPTSSATCTSAGPDPSTKKVQQLRLTVSSTDNRVAETIDIVKWKP